MSSTSPHPPSAAGQALSAPTTGRSSVVGFCAAGVGGAAAAAALAWLLLLLGGQFVSGVLVLSIVLGGVALFLAIFAIATRRGLKPAILGIGLIGLGATMVGIPVVVGIIGWMVAMTQIPVG